MSTTPGVREVARATEDWCFSEGGGNQLFGPASELSTVCLFGGGIVLALNDTDQQAAAAAVDEFLSTNDMYGPGGTVVDSLVGVDLMQGGELTGGGGRNLPGGGAQGAATVRWTLVAVSRFQVSGLPLSEGFNRQSYEGTITESTPADVSATGASFVLTVHISWRYFSGKRA